MNTRKLTLPLLVFIAPLAFSQGTFIYDQRSAIESGKLEGGMGIQSSHPIGQSFTPALSSVGFISLYLYDAGIGALGATVSVNLRSSSLDGTILGSTEPVSMQNAFAGFTNFIFSTPVQVTPGAVYFIQPVVQSGDAWGINKAQYNYAGGTAFYQGAPDASSDLWFGEGIIIPEPSPWVLLLASSMCFFANRIHRKKSTRID
jgi:hypothetical protein